MLTCFSDADSRLRYYACEALYNIVKVARGAVLPHFNVLFDGLSKVSPPPSSCPELPPPPRPGPPGLGCQLPFPRGGGADEQVLPGTLFVC